MPKRRRKVATVIVSRLHTLSPLDTIACSSYLKNLLTGLLGGLLMAHKILADTVASISELKKNPMATIREGDGEPVAILNRNEPAFYCIPAKAWEDLMDKLEDLELSKIAAQRMDGPTVKVTLDDL
jgi:antitoxin StbD